MNESEKKLKSVGTVSKKFTIPMLLWDEWEEDCRFNFNNTYHLKMQFDHEFRKQFNSVANLLMQDVTELKERVFELEAQNGEIIQKLNDISNRGKNLQNGSNKGPETTQKIKTFGSKK